MPEAEWFRRHLRVAGSASAGGVAWLDFSAPPDGACFALVDPVIAAVPAYRRPEGAPPCPKILNARIMDLIDPATYAKVKRDWIRVHFQYLMAGIASASMTISASSAVRSSSTTVMRAGKASPTIPA